MNQTMYLLLSEKQDLASGQVLAHQRSSPKKATDKPKDSTWDEKIVAGEAVSAFGAALQTIPAFVRRPVYVVLNLFSGRRRWGDLQCQISWAHQNAEYEIYVLSIDIVLSSSHGNLADQGVLDYWKRHIASGRVHSLLGGPPCESWSAARHNKIADLPADRQPRPLRSPENLWALSALSKSEYAQLHTANVLMWAMFQLTATMVQAGGSAIMEHPGVAWWNDKVPSVWNTWFMKVLSAVPAVEWHDFCQVRFGQVGVKPTRLMALRVPNLLILVGTVGKLVISKTLVLYVGS